MIIKATFHASPPAQRAGPQAPAGQRRQAPGRRRRPVALVRPLHRCAAVQRHFGQRLAEHSSCFYSITRRERTRPRRTQRPSATLTHFWL